MVLAHEMPFQWLLELEQKAQQKAQGLPRQEVIQHTWRGIAFRLGKTALVTPLDEIREVIHCPHVMARVPGAKPWVKGIANTRGLLLPVIDLQDCLSGLALTPQKINRLLILNQTGVCSGVLVDEVLGIKHFPHDDLEREAKVDVNWLQPFVRGMFKDEDTNWFVFDMMAFSKSRPFLEAAL